MKKILGLMATALIISIVTLSCGKSQTLTTSTQSASEANTSSQAVMESITIGTTTPSSMKQSEATIATTTQQTTSNPEVTSSLGQETLNPGGTGGEYIFAYYWKMAKPNSSFVPEELREAYYAWQDENFKKDTYNKGKLSLYDYLHAFKISEEYFREQNAKILDPFTDEEISDLFTLTKEEFNKKYAEPFFIVKGESMYDIRDLVLLNDAELVNLGVTKEEISAQLDKDYEIDPESVEYFRNKYGYR